MPARPLPRTALPHEVRIIGGRWKRTKLPVADRPGLRPTLDRVRETLFNWLDQDLSGWRCLDAFAGTGALGMEAASRGATEVVLLERDIHLVRQLKTLQQRLAATTLRIECVDALAWMERHAGQGLDLIFLDPPFEAKLFEAALRGATKVVKPDGWIYLEADRMLAEDEIAPLGLAVHRRGRAGSSTFICCAHAPRAPRPAPKLQAFSEESDP